jgi:hypothetical protein
MRKQQQGCSLGYSNRLKDRARVTSSMAEWRARSLTAWLGSLALLGGVSACGAQAPEGEPELGTVEQELYKYASTNLWNGNVFGTSAPVEACFTVRPYLNVNGTTRCTAQTSRSVDCEGNPISGLDLLRAGVALRNTDTWMKAGNIELYNWGDCPIDPATNKHKASAMVGKIAITFQRQVWGSETGIDQVLPSAGKHSNQSTLLILNLDAIENNGNTFNVIHEFGHALGFDHEWHRPDWFDANSLCWEKKWIPGTYFTPFPDEASKMEYCTEYLNNDPIDPTEGTAEDQSPVLSARDIMGVQVAYGRKYRGSIVGYGGECIDIEGGSTADNTPVVSYPCRNQWNDRFFRPNDTLEHLQSWSNSKCLNVKGGTAPNPLISWSCGNYANERFTFGNHVSVGAELRAMGKMCVAFNASTGRLELQTCNNFTPEQRWDLQHANGSIRSDQIRFMGLPGLCLSTLTTNGAVGERLQLLSCSATDMRQRFTYPGNGVIKMANNANLCLNVDHADVAPGTEVKLWSGCNDSPTPQNEQFHVHGRIRVLNHCVTIMPDGTISAQPCDANNQTTQMWDHYL